MPVEFESDLTVEASNGEAGIMTEELCAIRSIVALTIMSITGKLLDISPNLYYNTPSCYSQDFRPADLVFY